MIRLKKQSLALCFLVVLVFFLASCGSGGNSAENGAQTPGENEIMSKELTRDEEQILELVNVDPYTSSGVLSYNVSENLNTLHVKIAEYRSSSGEWRDITPDSQFENLGGKLLVTYENDGKYAKISSCAKDGGTTSSEHPNLKRLSLSDGLMCSVLEQPAAIKPDEEIAVHMLAQTKKTDDFETKEPSLDAYPQTEAFAPYKAVRAVIVWFSEE